MSFTEGDKFVGVLVIIVWLFICGFVAWRSTKKVDEVYVPPAMYIKNRDGTWSEKK